MNKSPLEKIKLHQRQLSDWQEEEHNFIPLSGSLDPNYRGSVVLDDEVGRFLSSDVHKVLLLVGHSGAGKSLFTQGLVSRLWGRYQGNAPIPLWISLPNCKNPEHRVIEETLEQCDLSESEIEDLRLNQSFIFILDAYDEIHCLKNLIVTNRLERWNTKIIITCRHEYLYLIDNFKALFSLYERNKPNYAASTILYVKPFSVEQIEQYVKHYISQHPDSEWRQWDDYSEALNQIPGVFELIKTPFVLKLAVESLPEIAKDYSHTDSYSENKQLTRAVLYDVFVKKWFERQEKKLKASRIIQQDENIQLTMWGYVKSLAQLMHQHGVVQVFYDPEEDSVFNDDAEANPFSEFFDPSIQRTQILMRSCFIRETSPKHYAFVHASLQEYFLTRDLYDSMKQTKKTDKKPEQKKVNPAKNRDYFNDRLLVDEDQVIQFLSDRVYEDPHFKQEMLDRIQASKFKPENAKGASNAITILIKAGVTFNNADLSGIQIPSGNISGGYFDGANISGADLSNAQMHHVWLRGANLEKSRVSNLHFGEYPWLKQDTEIKCLDYREDLQRIATSDEKEIILWDLVSGTKLLVLRGHTDKVTSLQISPDGKFLASGSWDHTVRIWDLEKNSVYVVLNGHSKWVQSVCFSPDGKYIASGSYDHTIKIWNILAKKEIVTLQGHQDYVNCVRFSPNSELLVSGSQDKSVRVWNIADKKEIAIFEGHDWWVHCVAFSPDGLRVISGSLDMTLRLWEIASKELVNIFKGHEGGINSVEFSADGAHILSASEDKTIRVWEVSSGTTTVVLRGHDANVMKALLSPDGERLVSCSADKTVRIWDVASGRYPARLSGHEKKISYLQISPDGNSVLSCSLDKTIRMTDLKTGKKIVEYMAHQNSVDCVQYRNDGKQFVSSGGDSVIKVWNTASQKPSKIYRGHKSTIGSIAYSHDGKWLVSGSHDKTVRIWDLESAREHGQWKGDNRSVTCVAFHPKLKQVASGGGDKNIKIWSIDGGEPLSVLNGHTDTIRCVQFSLEGEHLASCSNDKTIFVWNVKSSKPISILKGHENTVSSLQFCANDKNIISGSDDMTIRVWNIAVSHCVSLLRLHTRIGSFSFKSEELLVVGLDNGTMECWKTKKLETSEGWNLQWSTNINSRSLCVDNLKTDGAIGLSEQNCRLLEQRGADIKMSLLVDVSARSGSPVHQQSAVEASNVKKSGELQSGNQLLKK